MKKNSISVSKRITSVLLTLIMILSLFPFTLLSLAEEKSSVDVFFTLSEDGEFVVGNDSRATKLARLPVTVEYFDLADYGLEGFYRYEADSFENGGEYIGSEVLEQPTLLHLYIRMIEEYYLGGEKLTVGSDALTIVGSSTSMYMQQFWGHDENLMYFVDHAYPLMRENFGSTADYILLEDGMEIDVAMFSNWNFFMVGGFAFFDTTQARIDAGETVDFQTFTAPTSSAMDGSATVAQPKSGLTTKVYDAFWNEVDDITGTVDGDGSFSYTFANNGRYYVTAFDPNVGTSDADTAPAIATVYVGGDEVDYSDYPFYNITLLDEKTQLFDITVGSTDVDPWGMGSVNIPLYSLIVPHGTEYIYIYYPAGSDIAEFCAWYNNVTGEYPFGDDGLYSVEVLDDESIRLKVKVDIDDDLTPDTFILENNAYEFVEAFTFTFGEISQPGETPKVSVTGVALDTKSKNVERGAKIPLKATVYPDNASNKKLKWSSSDTKVAVVDDLGNVNVIGAGKADITVTTVDGSFSDKCSVVSVDEFAPEVIDGYYQIKTAKELEWFAREINQFDNYSAKAVLRNDIDLKTVCGEEIGSWTPIGNHFTGDQFTGEFNGNGFTILNLYIYDDISGAETSYYYKALFGYCSGAKISNLTLRGNVYSKNRNVAALVGNASGETVIDNCHNYAEVTQGANAYSGAAGLIANFSSGTLKNSSNHAKINGTVGRVGGLVGTLVNTNSQIIACYNTGDILATKTTINNGEKGVGGLVGYSASAAPITYSYNTGKVTAELSQFIGGIIGFGDRIKINSSYNSGLVSGGAGSSIGGVVGFANYPASANHFYLSGSVTGGDSDASRAVAVTAEVLKAAAMIDTLNGEEHYFIADSSDEPLNSGYPVLAGNDHVDINLASNPTQNEYLEGEAFSAEGLEIYAVFYNGSAPVKITDYEVTPSGALSLEDDKVTVSGSYQDNDFSFEIDVTVYENAVENLLIKDSDQKQLALSPAFNKDGFEYTLRVSPYESEISLMAQSVTSKSIIKVNSQTSENGIFILPLEGLEEIEVFVGNEDGVGKTYTIEVLVIPVIESGITLSPADSNIFLVDAKAKRIFPEETGLYTLLEGEPYYYIITRAGYVGVSGSFNASESGFELELAVAQENDKINNNLPAEWPSFRGNDENNAVIDYKTPTKADDATLYWAVKYGSGFGGNATGSPIIVNNHLILTAKNKIYKIDKYNGEIVAQGEMVGTSSFNITPPLYVEGMVFVGLANGKIQAFNADTMESLWVYSDKLEGQPNSPIAYKDGYIYTGFWNGESLDANFVCLSITDEDVENATEEKLPTWTHAQAGGFYWSGAYADENFILVGTDDGKSGYDSNTSGILSLDPKSGKIIDKIDTLKGDIRSSVSYDKVTDRYYFTSKGGNFYGLAVNEDGTFKLKEGGEYDLKVVPLSNGSNSASTLPMSTSTPAIYNGRAYIGVSGTSQFGQYTGHNITVIDLVEWEVAYKVPTKGYPQTSGLVSTAYEDEEGYAYVYFIDNYTPGELRVIKDKPGVTSVIGGVTERFMSGGKETVIENCAPVLFTPSGAHSQYAICSPIADDEGTIYFKNDSSYLLALGSKIENIVVTNPPEKTVYLDGEVFETDGMKVAAVLANGIIRDITNYVEVSKDPLSLIDTDVTVYYNGVLYKDNFDALNGNKTNVKVIPPETYVDLTVLSQEDYDALKNAEALIGAIGGADAVTLESADAIGEARSAFDDLSIDLQELVSNYSNLTDAEEEYNAIKAVFDGIEAIETVTFDKLSLIVSARQAYQLLSEAQQVKITNYEKLTVAEEEYQELLAEISAVEELIEAIGEVTINSGEDIDIAQEAYDALPAESKNAVSNFSDLENATATLAGLKGQIKAVEDLIGAIGTPAEVTYAKKGAVDAARTAYDALDDSLKDKVSNLEALTEAEGIIEELSVAIEEVAALIEAIGEVTMESGEDINAARAAYDLLADDLKAGVSNYNKLTEGEAKLLSLQKTVEEVEQLIDEIGEPSEINITSGDAIKAARDAYDKLDKGLKAYVSNYELLVSLEEAFETAKKNYKEIYSVTAEGTVWTKGSGKTHTVKIDADYNKFLSVYLDGELLAENSYTVISGSTIVTLKPELLETLSAGSHELRVNFIDGYAITQLVVEEKKIIDDGKDKDGDKDKDTDKENPPATGQNETGLIYYAVFALSLAAYIFTKKKRDAKNA